MMLFLLMSPALVSMLGFMLPFCYFSVQRTICVAAFRSMFHFSARRRFLNSFLTLALAAVGIVRDDAEHCSVLYSACNEIADVNNWELSSVVV